jgi:hypothetical protein
VRVRGGRARVLRSLPTLGSLLILGFVLLPSNGFTPGSSTHPAHRPVSIAGAASTPCPGALLPAQAVGLLNVLGGSNSSALLANRSVTIGYELQTRFTPQNGTAMTSCAAINVTVTTGAAGGFTVQASIPASSCTRYSCTNYSGPYGPWVVVRAPPPPAEFFVSSHVTSNSIRISFVADLASARLQPGANTTVSANAPVSVRVVALAGDGSPARAPLTYGWSVSGQNWSVLSGGGASLTVRAGSASVASVAAWVNSTNGSVSVHLAPLRVKLAAVTTAVLSTARNLSAIDQGQAVTVTVLASGAPGYAYQARFSTAGQNPSNGSCPDLSTESNLLYFRCSTSVTLTQPGLIRPSVDISNGFSNVTASIPAIRVNPYLAVQVSPAGVAGEVGSNLSVTIGPRSGTGTAPFGSTCLRLPTGSLFCHSTPGLFEVPLGSVFNGTAEAWVLDSTGANASLAFPCVAVLPLVLGPLSPPPPVPVGSFAHWKVNVSGGLRPAEFWWNSSALGPLKSGWLRGSGALELVYFPTHAGGETITLVVRDSVGAVVSRSVPLAVTPGPAIRLMGEGPGPVEMTAGAPLTLTWRAVDATSSIVSSYASAVVMRISGNGVGGFQLSAPSGPGLDPIAPGLFEVPPTAWAAGELELTLETPVASVAQLQLEAPLPVSGEGSRGIDVVVLPDLGALVLSSPVTHLLPSGANHTLWRIADRFGNPLVGGAVRIEALTAGILTVSTSWIEPDGPQSFLWVNLSAPSDAPTTVRVLSESGQPLLPTLTVPARPVVPPTVLLATLGVGASAASAAVVAILLRRARHARMLALPADEEELRRLAEVRDFLLDCLGSGPATLEEIVASPAAPAPRTEVVDALATLVAEGAILAQQASDGTPRFSLRPTRDEKPPRVEINPELLEAALASGRSSLGPEDSPDPEFTPD